MLCEIQLDPQKRNTFISNVPPFQINGAFYSNNLVRATLTFVCDERIPVQNPRQVLFAVDAESAKHIMPTDMVPVYNETTLTVAGFLFIQ